MRNILNNGYKGGMGVYKMDQNNQLAANASFCGTNNSAAGFNRFDTPSSTSSSTVAGSTSSSSSTNNTGGMFSSFFGGTPAAKTAAAPGGSSQIAAVSSVTTSGSGAFGSAMRDFNVWMPQSM